MVKPELKTPDQPVTEEPQELRYLMACIECPPTGPRNKRLVHVFDSDEERGLWAVNHTNWAGHTAFMAREEPKT